MTIEMTKEEKAAIARLLVSAMADDDKPAISALAKVFAAAAVKPETTPAPASPPKPQKPLERLGGDSAPRPSFEPPHTC